MGGELRLLWQEALGLARDYAREAVRPFTVGGKLDRGTPNAVGRTPVAGGGTGHGQGAEPPLGNPAADGQLLTSTAAGVRAWRDPLAATGGLRVRDAGGATDLAGRAALRLYGGIVAPDGATGAGYRPSVVSDGATVRHLVPLTTSGGDPITDGDGAPVYGYAPAPGGGATNLSATPSPTAVVVASDTGADATIPAADATNAGVLLPAEKSKLAGVAAGAQVNVLESVTGTAPIVVGAVSGKAQAVSIAAATESAPGSMSAADFAALQTIKALPYVLVANLVAQSISNAAWNTQLFDTDQDDALGFHDTAANTSRLTVPAGRAGLYLLAANVQFATNATGARFVRLLLNGTNQVAIFNSPAVGGFATRALVVALRRLVAGDYLEVQVYQDSGAALDTAAHAEAGAGQAPCWFRASWLRA